MKNSGMDAGYRAAGYNSHLPAFPIAPAIAQGGFVQPGMVVGPRAPTRPRSHSAMTMGPGKGANKPRPHRTDYSTSFRTSRWADSSGPSGIALYPRTINEKASAGLPPDNSPAGKLRSGGPHREYTR